MAATRFLENQKYISPVEAAKQAEVAYMTVINWARKYDFAQKIGGRWRIRREDFTRFLDHGNQDGTQAEE